MRQTLIILFIFLFGTFFSQNKKIDSLLLLLKKPSHDTIKIKNYKSLAAAYFNLKDSASTFESQKKAKLLSGAYNKFYVSILRKDAFYLRKLAHYNQAIDTLLKAISVCDKNNLAVLAGAYNDINVCYRTAANFEKAIYFGLKSASICDNSLPLDSNTKIHTYNGLANSYAAFGNFKKDTSNFSKAIFFYNKSKKFTNAASAKKEDINFMAMLENNIGLSKGYVGKIIKNQNYLLEAIANHEKALEIRRSLFDSLGLIDSYANLGVVYHDLAQLNNSIIYCKKAIENHNVAVKIGELIGYKESLNLIANQIAELLLYNTIIHSKENLDEIISKSKNLLLRTQTAGNLDIEMNCLENLATAYEQQGDYKTSLEYTKKFIQMKDKLLSAENSKAIEELSSKYESDKKDKENLLLKKETEAQNATLERQKTLNYAYIVGLVFVIIFIIMIYKNLSNSKKATIAITEQKRIIEEKANEVAVRQKEIIQSIEYAKRIQQSLLPTKKYINKNLNKS